MRTLIIVVFVVVTMAPHAHSAEAYIDAYSIMLLKSPTDAAAVFNVEYGLRTTLPDENPCADFPESAFGGTFAGCGAYSRQGLSLSFTDPISWVGVWIFEPDSPIDFVEPDEIRQATLSGQAVPFVAETLTYRDGNLLPWVLGDQTHYRSDILWLHPDPSNPTENIWRASTCLEILATYKDGENTVVGTMFGSEVGLQPLCAEAEWDELFSYVSTAKTSWGRIKALY